MLQITRHHNSFFNLPIRKKIAGTLILLAIFFCSPNSYLRAGDWSQILGPTRNGIAAADEKISWDWAQGGPALLWKKPVGTGVAGVAVQGETVILFHRLKDKEHIVAYHKTTGQKKWEQSFATNYIARIVPDNGPLCVPVITGTRVIAYGASGGLHCLNLQTGEVHWSLETHEKYKAKEGYFGAGSTPIVFKKMVLVNVGGFRNQAGVVAFSLETGKQIWKTGAWKPAYSSPVLTTFQKKPLVVFSTREQTVGLNPETGAEQFSFPFGQRGPTVNGANPVIIGEHLFLTASYGIGNVYAKMQPGKVKVIREGLKPLASQYTTPVVVGKSLIGIDGRQDGGQSDLVCFDPISGKEFWRQPAFGYATIIKVGKQLLILKTEGELVIVKASTKAYQQLSRAKLTDSKSRALPALSQGKLYFRDEKLLRCYDLNPKH